MSTVTNQTTSSPGLLRQIQRAYHGRRTATVVLPTVAFIGLLGGLAERFPSSRLLLSGLGLAILAFSAWRLWLIWRQPLGATAQRLDRQFAELEDSTGLLLRPDGELNLLEQLQRQHITTRLKQLQQQKQALLPVSYTPALAVTAAALMALLGLKFWPQPAASVASPGPNVALHFPANPGKAAASVPARLTETHIQIAPPAYTRRPGFTAAEPSFRCPQGSRVQWTVRVSRAAGGAPQLEVGGQRLRFQPVVGQPLEFTVAHVFTTSTLYRIRFAGQVSDDYAVEVQPDRGPAIQIRTPKPYTLVEFGQKPQVNVQVALSDDYGLTRARLVATVAQGQGEAVKFKEVATDLSSGLRKQPNQASLSHLLGLPALGLTYGDEVYFYVQAWDNNRHSTRSDTYLVQWEDTTVDDSGSDMAMGVNVVPAYFRSQRQVIIDTEKLLAERKQLDASSFTTRSNDLGHDQKVLRLRYGKFLGEEFEESFGQSATRPPVAEPDDDHAGEAPHAEGEEVGHEHEHGTAPAADASPTAESAALLDPYVHHHDDSETADFLEPAVKAKLRGVLSQMWEAELRLRTARPAEALPYEYRALRLLKQVQQQTRLYVRKSGFEPPVIPESTTRLSGELQGASTPKLQAQLPAPATQPTIQAALRLLSTLRQGTAVKPAEAVILEQASPAAAQAALRNPGRYLSAVRHLRRLATEIRGELPRANPALPPSNRPLRTCFRRRPRLPAARSGPTGWPGAISRS
ncbi:DUF4175 domain-containing protein [Hymenobacter cellulosivorans]|uniref:DUF4175 domain-containing protein n=1 Tax=Hymenobacter cellulosivorans TaxID=2932249 RepID=A0ABY4FCU6_9BACT|nr:DUF4175 domain-containing protein [Hymenobacter cellulosivorans]UOQ54364.1 DUF4175 domain-containing protein [Hymenobacter cellulosivorans]